MGAAEQSADASNQLTRREGLDEVVVGTELEADDAVLDLALGGEHDDGNVGGLADGTAHALAGEFGQHEVEDHEVERVLLELLHGALSVADPTHDVVLALKIGCNRIADGFLVLNE